MDFPITEVALSSYSVSPCTETSPGKLLVCTLPTAIPFQRHRLNSCSSHCPTSLHERPLCFSLICSSVPGMSGWQLGWLIWTFFANMHVYCYQFRANNPMLSWPHRFWNAVFSFTSKDLQVSFLFLLGACFYLVFSYLGSFREIVSIMDFEYIPPLP